MALQKFEEALDTDPSNTDTLSYRAEVFSKLIEIEFINVPSSVESFEDHPRVQQAKEYFERAIVGWGGRGEGGRGGRGGGGLVETMFLYAQFLEKCGDYEKAEQCYLSALEMNPTHVNTLKEYGNFLSELGEHSEAEKFYVRCSEVTKKRGERMEGGGGEGVDA